MSEPKTVKTDASVADFLAAVPDQQRRADAIALCDLMREVTGVEPALWGPSIVGFGSYHYVYGSGRQGEWPAVGFSPRKAATTVYVSDGVQVHADLLRQLGSHTVGKGCIYLKRLATVDLIVLRKLVGESFRRLDGQQVTSGGD